jgi:hypothetical protein
MIDKNTKLIKIAVVSVDAGDNWGQSQVPEYDSGT